MHGSKLGSDELKATKEGMGWPLDPFLIPDAVSARWAKRREEWTGARKTWDENWVPMMEMSDAGENPLQGGLLYAEYGQGDYVYCSLAIYRQLRLGNPGAARILVNLLTQG